MEPNGADHYPECKTNHAHYRKICSDCGLVIGSDAADDEHTNVIVVKTRRELIIPLDDFLAEREQ